MLRCIYDGKLHQLLLEIDTYLELKNLLRQTLI